MAQFSVRVELHAASYADYEKLHASMERRGFSRLIKSDAGKTYHLPTAEYDGGGDVTCQQVLEFAKAAAAETGKSFEVFVTESAARLWFGMKEVPVNRQFANCR
jgi:hypothetical protein